MKHSYLILVALLFSFFTYAQIPPNDEIQNAVNIASLPFEDLNVQTQNATTASGGGMQTCDLQPTSTRVYYRFQPSDDLTLKVDILSPSTSPFIIVYQSSVANATLDSQLTLAPGSDCTFSSSNFLDLVANQVYYILIGNPDNATDISFESILPPPNNNGVQTALNITSLPFVDLDVQAHLAVYTDVGTGLSGCQVGSVPRVYYRYKPTNNVTLTVNLSNGDEPSSYIVVFQSSVEYASSNTQLTYNNDGSCINGTNITVDLLANQVYYILVRNQYTATDIQFVEVDNTNIVNIPDANFKNALLNQTNPVINTNNDTEIQVSEAFFTDIIYASNLNILDLSGVEAFTNLKKLYCNGNNLTSLNVTQNVNLDILFASFNENLGNIDVSYNLSLEVLFLENCDLTNDLDLTNNVNLKIIYIGNNSISNVNLTQNINLEELNLDFSDYSNIDLSIFPNLTWLSIYSADFSSLDLTQNSNLTLFSASRNNFSQIDVSQNLNLTRLVLDENQITSLDVTNNINLIQLFVSENNLNSLDISQNTNLEQLFCDSNQITDLDVTGNPYLYRLWASDNLFTTIDLSQNTELIQFRAQNTLLQTLDLSNNPNMYWLDVENSNYLETINFKNGNNNIFDNDFFYTSNSGDVLTFSNPFLKTENNPNLQTICVDDVAYATTKFTDIDPNTVFVDDCSINSINYNSIQGILAFDDENNGCDTNDFVVANQLIQASDGVNNMATFTNSTGDYTLYLNESTYNAEAVGLASNFSVTPNPYNTTFTGFGTSENADFCITSSQTMNDVNVVLLPVIKARPGFDASYQLVFENTGTTLISGDITLNFDDASQTFVSASPTESTSTSSSLTFNYTNLQPFEIRTIDVVMNTFPPTTVNDGDILNFTAIINPISGDTNQDDNTFSLEQTVVNSYDPNDKQVLQGTEISLPQASEYLDYMVRFQNTGSASAINVVITDVLNEKLDWSTIRPISSSHEFTTRILNGDFVEFNFENINLPAQVNDDAGSNGFVAFKIKPKADVVVGDFILGKANIYFDYNAAIVTNTVSTEVVTELSIQENVYESSIKIYPNPVNDNLYINSKNPLKQISIYDMQGRQLKTIALTGNTTATQVDLSTLSKGVYFVSIKTEIGDQTSKIIKE